MKAALRTTIDCMGEACSRCSISRLPASSGTRALAREGRHGGLHEALHAGFLAERDQSQRPFVDAARVVAALLRDDAVGRGDHDVDAVQRAADRRLVRQVADRVCDDAVIWILDDGAWTADQGGDVIAALG